MMKLLCRKYYVKIVSDTAGAETTQFYHHNETHQQGFHTPSPYRTMPYGASLCDNVGRHDIDNF